MSQIEESYSLKNIRVTGEKLQMILDRYRGTLQRFGYLYSSDKILAEASGKMFSQSLREHEIELAEIAVKRWLLFADSIVIRRTQYGSQTPNSSYEIRISSYSSERIKGYRRDLEEMLRSKI